MEPEKQRGKLATALIILMPALNLITSLAVLFVASDKGWPDLTVMSVIVAVIVIASIAAGIGAWKWKKWGFYLFIIACVAAAVIAVFSLYLAALAAIIAAGATLFAANMVPLYKYLD